MIFNGNDYAPKDDPYTDEEREEMQIDEYERQYESTKNDEL